MTQGRIGDLWNQRFEAQSCRNFFVVVHKRFLDRWISPAKKKGTGWDVGAFPLFYKNDFWETDFVWQQGNWKIESGKVPASLGFIICWCKNVLPFFAIPK